MNPLLKRAIMEPREFDRSVRTAWEQYHTAGRLSGGPVRQEILKSWQQSKDQGVDPFQKKIEEIIPLHDLESRVQQNEQLLSYASRGITQLRDLLDESKTMLSITDRHGTIIHSSGNPSTIKQAEILNIFDGGTWSEQSAGTNGVGLALETKTSVQVLFSEHFCEKNHDWFCAATPILAPFTREVVGVVNIAGTDQKLHPHTLGLLVSEAKSLAGTVIRELYDQAISENFFAGNSLSGGRDTVFVVDSRKKIMDQNRLAVEQPSLLKAVRSGTVEGLEAFIDLSMLSGQKVLNEHVTNLETGERYLCSVYPLVFQEMHLGAVLFLRKQQIVAQSAVRLTTKTADATANAAFAGILGSSPAMSRAIQQAEKAAAIDFTLFLSGETGTGKEVFAQAIHRAGSRKNKPFVAINCGAVPSGLLESELSGYEAGAFTGAKAKGSPGKFEMAQGGTVFLDEIGDMPLELQVHLLRILEEREVTRIGGARPIPVDVRVIAATHHNLEQLVEEGRFREDLLYRLKVIQLELPPLRARKEDIEELCQCFINEYAGPFGKSNVWLSPEVLECLESHSWPGNIRELKNVIQQALFNMDGEMLLPEHLPGSLSVVSSLTEQDQLKAALRKEKGNVSNAAKQLGISRATFYRRMKQYGM